MPAQENIPRPADERDARGRLTRAGMEAVLRRGESLLLGDRVINRVEDLPDEADLAAGDEARTARAREALLAQKEAVEKQLAKLDAPPPAAVPQVPEATTTPATETKADEPPPSPPEGEAKPDGDEPSLEAGPFSKPFGGRKR